MSAMVHPILTIIMITVWRDAADLGVLCALFLIIYQVDYN